MATENFKTRSSTNNYGSNKCIRSGSIYVDDITGSITNITLYLGAYGATVPAGSTITLHAYKNGSLVGPSDGFSISFKSSLSNGGTPKDWQPSQLNGIVLNSGDELELKISDSYTHDNICIVYDKCTITTDGSSGDSGDSGDDSDGEFQGSISTSGWPREGSVFSKSETINLSYTGSVGYGIATRVALYVNSTQYSVQNVNGNYFNGSFHYTFPKTGEYTFELRLFGYYKPEDGEKLQESTSDYIYYCAGNLKSITNLKIESPNFGTKKEIGFSSPNEDYKIIWDSAEDNYNKVSQYNIYANNVLKVQSVNTNYLFTNSLQEKEKINYNIEAIGMYNNSKTYSTDLIVYNLIINPQTYISCNNSELLIGEAKLDWEAPNIIVDDDIKNNFTWTYNLKYETSDDKNTWVTGSVLASNLTNPTFTIDDISSLNLNNKFIRFIIENKIFYNGNSLKIISTEKVNGLIKYGGKKPNQLKLIRFNAINKKGKTKNSELEYINNDYIWNSSDYNIITKDGNIHIEFGENIEGYKPGVSISWEKNNIKGVKEVYADSETATSLDIPLNNFEDDFWNTKGTLYLTITSSSFITNRNFSILEEERGYFYRGIVIQTAKLPEMKTNYSFISTPNTNIPVNFNPNNPEPIVNNKYYEDKKITGLIATHPQGLDIYGYKVYFGAFINNVWDFQMITDKLLTASKGEKSYNDGLLVPIWERDMGGYFEQIQDNIISLELNILNKYQHLEQRLLETGKLETGKTIADFNEKIRVGYRVTAVDEFGQESENYFEHLFYYDFRKPAEFETAPVIASPSDFNNREIAIYNESINVIPVFNNDAMLIEFYPAINLKDKENNPDNYFTYGGKTYLKKSDEIIDPNNYTLYKFVKQSNGELRSYLIQNIQPSLVNSTVLPYGRTIGDEEALYYLYQLNFKLNDVNIDEIEYFQIVPYYTEVGELKRESRLYCYTNNDKDENGNSLDNCNKFNIAIGSSEASAAFWNSRIDNPKIRLGGIERISTTKDDFDFSLPKLKLSVSDWGTTHQFVDDKELSKNELIPFNRLTNLSYQIKYYKENKKEDDSIEKEYLEGKDWNREYLNNSNEVIDYDTLSLEYGYTNFEELREHLNDDKKTDYNNINGTDKLPIPTTGTMLYINLPSPIKGTEAYSEKFYAELSIIGQVERVSINNDNTATYKPYIIELADSFYISQNKKTFIIQQGKLGINQPDLNNIEESFYIIDKKYTTKENSTYPNILGLELDSTFNKNNDITGAFIGFYDDSIRNGGPRILMGSFGMGVEIDNSDKAISYTPYVIYNKIDEEGNLTLTTLNLIPEGGAGIKVDGNIISHSNDFIEPVNNNSFSKVNYDELGHITGSAAVEMSDIRSIGRIVYGDAEPGVEGFNPFGDGSIAEGDIYLWIQSE